MDDDPFAGGPPPAPTDSEYEDESPPPVPSESEDEAPPPSQPVDVKKVVQQPPRQKRPSEISNKASMLLSMLRKKTTRTKRKSILDHVNEDALPGRQERQSPPVTLHSTVMHIPTMNIPTMTITPQVVDTPTMTMPTMPTMITPQVVETPVVQSTQPVHLKVRQAPVPEPPSPDVEPQSPIPPPPPEEDGESMGETVAVIEEDNAPPPPPEDGDYSDNQVGLADSDYYDEPASDSTDGVEGDPEIGVEQNGTADIGGEVEFDLDNEVIASHVKDAPANGDGDGAPSVPTGAVKPRKASQRVAVSVGVGVVPKPKQRKPARRRRRGMNMSMGNLMNFQELAKTQGTAPGVSFQEQLQQKNSNSSAAAESKRDSGNTSGGGSGDLAAIANRVAQMRTRQMRLYLAHFAQHSASWKRFELQQRGYNMFVRDTKQMLESRVAFEPLSKNKSNDVSLHFRNYLFSCFISEGSQAQAFHDLPMAFTDLKSQFQLLQNRLNHVQTRIGKFISKDVSHALKEYEKEEYLYRKALKDYLRNCGRDGMEKEREAMAAKKTELERMRLDLIRAVSQLHTSREYFAAEHLCSLMDFYWDFFRSGYRILKEYRDKHEELREHCDELRDQIQLDRKISKDVRVMHEQYLEQHLAVQRDESLGKSGTGIRDLDTSQGVSKTLSGLVWDPNQCFLEGFLCTPHPNFARYWATLNLESVVQVGQLGRGGGKQGGDSIVLYLRKLATQKQIRSKKKYSWMDEKTGLDSLKKSDKERKSTEQTINMMLATIKRVPPSSRSGDFVFDLVTPQQSLRFQCENRAEYEKWIMCLQNAIGAALNSQKKQGKFGYFVGRGMLSEVQRIFRQDVTSFLDAEEGGGADGKQGKLRRVWSGGEGSNAQCADCGKPNPDWVSINLGITMCLECSGVHRAMGVHISKVRSATLDDLDTYQLLLLSNIGNKWSNSVWGGGGAMEQWVRENSTAERKTGDGTAQEISRSDREAFIRAKYEAQKFIKLPDSGTDGELTPSLASSRASRAIVENALPQLLKWVALCADVVGARFDPDCGADQAQNLTGDVRALTEELSQQAAKAACTMLHGATLLQNAGCVELLLQNGAECSAADGKGEVPLHYAIRQRWVDGVRLLLLRGGPKQVQVRNLSGLSCVALCRQMQQESNSKDEQLTVISDMVTRAADRLAQRRASKRKSIIREKAMDAKLGSGGRRFGRPSVINAVPFKQ